MRLTMLLLALAGTGAWAAEPKRGQQEGVIDPKADAALRQMSGYLAGLKTLRVDSTTVDEKITTSGQKIQELQSSQITMQRPGALRIDRFSPAGHVVFVDDGKRFSVYNKEQNVFATAPAPADLDRAIDDARDRLHVDAPGGDLLVSDPYHEIIDGMLVGRYIGLEPIDGVMAHHIAVVKDHVDWQLWIKDGPEAVPLRYVITSKDMTGHPQFTLEMRNWQPNAPVSADSFAFTPPPNAKRVDFALPKKAER